MDVVYVFKQSDSNDSAELRYSLRSLKNLRHEKVFIVGDIPEWTQRVACIRVPQDGTKAENVARNLAAAASSNQISEDFIMMNDDFFVMKPYTAMPTLHWGKLSDVLAVFLKKYGLERPYTSQMQQMYNLLLSEKITEPLSYELHVPFVLNKIRLLKLLARYTGPMSQFRTYYGNHCSVGGSYMADSKITLYVADNDPNYTADPLRYLQAQPFLSANSTSFDKGLVGQFIRNAFPNKSLYEL